MSEDPLVCVIYTVIYCSVLGYYFSILQTQALRVVCAGSLCGYIKGDSIQQSLTTKHFWLSTETIKELMWHTGPFVFVTRLLSTLLMCFQDAVTDFSLKAEIHPNYSHCEVSSMVKTFSHGVSTVTYILITHLPESCSQSAAHGHQPFVQKVHYVYCVCIRLYTRTRVCVYLCIKNLSVS